jgi:hypothetical protein
MQVDDPAPLVVSMRIESAAIRAALRATARGRYFLICGSHALAKCRIWTRRHAAGQASPKCRDDRRDALDQEVKRVSELQLVSLDLRVPIAGKAQCHKAGIGIHVATPVSLEMARSLGRPT